MTYCHVVYVVLNQQVSAHVGMTNRQGVPNNTVTKMLNHITLEGDWNRFDLCKILTDLESPDLVIAPIRSRWYLIGNTIPN